ncbi:hypothetical protein KFK09_001629 [Dendrobium nobile]|uniref:Uncharacterized protein n=1 Tax=Dendrobium nobile TaxID=94219 RepID=A0A8T3C5N7_DENNO|nr:hypothetical protein KFK09_001629 [Dendrobium nobile]
MWEEESGSSECRSSHLVRYLTATWALDQGKKRGRRRRIRAGIAEECLERRRFSGICGMIRGSDGYKVGKVIDYASKMLKLYENKYPTQDMELETIVFS